MIEGLHEGEQERFCSLLSTALDIKILSSRDGWILARVSRPKEVAQRVNRSLKKGELISVPRHVPEAIWIMVSDSRTNQEVLRVLGEILVGNDE
jgi:hypothetical protein